RHYGNITRSMVEYALSLEEGEEKQALVESIGNVMKKNYLVWNKDNVEDDVILKNLRDLSEGKLKTEGITLSEKRDLVQNVPQHNHNKRKRNNNNNRPKRKNNKKK
ncbi:MAG: DUF4290 domain-containing protein, partial [Croceimicrobium sp.]